MWCMFVCVLNGGLWGTAVHLTPTQSTPPLTYPATPHHLAPSPPKRKRGPPPTCRDQPDWPRRSPQTRSSAASPSPPRSCRGPRPAARCPSGSCSRRSRGWLRRPVGWGGGVFFWGGVYVRVASCKKGPGELYRMQWWNQQLVVKPAACWIKPTSQLKPRYRTNLSAVLSRHELLPPPLQRPKLCDGVPKQHKHGLEGCGGGITVPCCCLCGVFSPSVCSGCSASVGKKMERVVSLSTGMTACLLPAKRWDTLHTAHSATHYWQQRHGHTHTLCRRRSSSQEQCHYGKPSAGTRLLAIMASAAVLRFLAHPDDQFILCDLKSRWLLNASVVEENREFCGTQQTLRWERAAPQRLDGSTANAMLPDALYPSSHICSIKRISAHFVANCQLPGCARALERGTGPVPWASETSLCELIVCLKQSNFYIEVWRMQCDHSHSILGVAYTPLLLLLLGQCVSANRCLSSRWCICSSYNRHIITLSCTTGLLFDTLPRDSQLLFQFPRESPPRRYATHHSACVPTYVADGMENQLLWCPAQQRAPCKSQRRRSERSRRAPSAPPEAVRICVHPPPLTPYRPRTCVLVQVCWERAAVVRFPRPRVTHTHTHTGSQAINYGRRTGAHLRHCPVLLLPSDRGAFMICAAWRSGPAPVVLGVQTSRRRVALLQLAAAGLSSAVWPLTPPPKCRCSCSGAAARTCWSTCCWPFWACTWEVGGRWWIYDCGLRLQSWINQADPAVLLCWHVPLVVANPQQLALRRRAKSGALAACKRPPSRRSCSLQRRFCSSSLPPNQPRQHGFAPTRKHPTTAPPHRRHDTRSVDCSVRRRKGRPPHQPAARHPSPPAAAPHPRGGAAGGVRAAADGRHRAGCGAGLPCDAACGLHQQVVIIRWAMVSVVITRWRCDAATLIDCICVDICAHATSCCCCCCCVAILLELWEPSSAANL